MKTEETKSNPKVNKLTDDKIKSLEGREKEYKVSDGRGLYILVTPHGSKSWKLKYRYKRIEKKLTFGMYPFVSIKEARLRRDDAWRLLNEGFDPVSTYKYKKAKNIVTSFDIEYQAIKIKDYIKHEKEFSRDILQAVNSIRAICDVLSKLLEKRSK